MKPLTLQEIKRAVSGRSFSVIPQHGPVIKSICTDTRRIENGCLFVALKGDKFDAHDFLADAAKGGAAAAIVRASGGSE